MIIIMLRLLMIVSVSRNIFKFIGICLFSSVMILSVNVILVVVGIV